MSADYIDDGAPVLDDPAGHGAVGFCGALCGGVFPGAGFVEFGGVGAVPDGAGFAPGFGVVGFPAEFVGGMVGFPAGLLGIVPGAGTQGPFVGAGAGVVGDALPGVSGFGDVWGVGVVSFCGGL